MIGKIASLAGSTDQHKSTLQVRRASPCPKHKVYCVDQHAVHLYRCNVPGVHWVKGLGLKDGVVGFRTIA